MTEAVQRELENALHEQEEAMTALAEAVGNGSDETAAMERVQAAHARVGYLTWHAKRDEFERCVCCARTHGELVWLPSSWPRLHRSYYDW